MKDLITMQREGRKAVDICIYHLLNDQNDKEKLLKHLADLDQHTANVWKAAQESMKKNILESGLLEEKDDLDVIVQEKLKEDRERIFKEIDWYFKTTDYKEVLVSDLQNIINSDTDVTN